MVFGIEKLCICKFFYKFGGVKNMADILVVASKVKEAVKKHDMNTAGDFPEGLSVKVADMIKTAVDRAKGNGRKTVRAADL